MVDELADLISGVLVAGTFSFADNAGFGKLKVTTGFVLALVSIFVEENPLGTIAAVESGVVLMLVVVVEELRVAQVAEHVTGGGGVAVLTSSAWITTSGLNLPSAFPDIASNML